MKKLWAIKDIDGVIWATKEGAVQTLEESIDAVRKHPKEFGGAAATRDIVERMRKAKIVRVVFEEVKR
jgi:tripartite-type tricarboxylate transporter receptor subunit TctC